MWPSVPGDYSVRWPQPESCQSENRLSSEFPREDAACRAASGRRTFFCHQRGETKSPVAHLKLLPPPPPPLGLTFPLLRVGITARAHPGPASVDLTPTRGNMAEALAQNKQPRLCADPALSGSLMLICPGSLPSVTSALPGRPSRGIDCTPSHVSVFLRVASPALFYSPSSQ